MAREPVTSGAVLVSKVLPAKPNREAEWLPSPTDLWAKEVIGIILSNIRRCQRVPCLRRCGGEILEQPGIRLSRLSPAQDQVPTVLQHIRDAARESGGGRAVDDSMIVG